MAELTSELAIRTAAPPPAPGRRPFTTGDMACLIPLEDLAVSASGAQAVFRRSDVTAEGDSREETVWLLDLEAASAALLPGYEDGDEGHAFGGAGGMNIAFLRDVDGAAQVHLLPGAGGHAEEVRVVSQVPGPGRVAGFLWAPDGARMAVLSVEEAEEPPAGVRISTRADFKAADGGFLRATIWVVDVAAGAVGEEVGLARALTTVASPVELAFWAPDGTALFYTTEDTVEAYYGEARSSLRSVRLQGGGGGEEAMAMRLKVPLTGEDMESAPRFALSPDGTRVAFSMGNPLAPDEFAQDDVFVMTLATGDVDVVTAGYDREVGGDGFQWLDDERILAIHADEGSAGLVVVNTTTHEVTPWWTGQHVVDSFAISGDGKRILAVASDFVSPAEIYDVSEAEPQTATLLTAINKPLTDELLLTEPEVISYTGPAGHSIHGFLLYPPTTTSSSPSSLAAASVPMITLAHGGPYACWGPSFLPDAHAIAAAGYAVFLPNPRGSASYGQAFASALAAGWPGPEYDDIMAGIDHLLASRPHLDAARLGISGASAGGTLTDWAITHTSRFAAAVSISDIADFNLYWFLGDQPDVASRHARPWLDPKDKALSPLTTPETSTPTLFVAGTRDARTPPAVGAELMFRLLKHLRVPTALVEFEGAGHAVHRSGDARHRGLSVWYLLRWMDLYLRGVPAPEFDVRAAS